MFETGFRLIVRVRAIAVHDAGVPRCSRIHSLVAGFAAAAFSVNDGIRPGFTVAETRLVVVCKHAEHRNSEADGRQLLHVGGGYTLGIFLSKPPEVRSVDQM